MSTYVPIQAITLSATAANVTFSAIPQTYTDLVIVVTGTVSVANNITLQFNGDTGSNYSWTYIAGNGTSPSSGRGSSTTSILSAGFGTSTIANVIYQIQSYSNITTNKTVLSRGNRSDDGTTAWVGLWRKTEAISSLVIGAGGGNFNIGATFTLYGIGSGSPKAFGGDEVRTDGTYWYHIFRSSGRFETVQALTCDYLVIGGGGGGGNTLGVDRPGGGGGAGGYRTTVGTSGGNSSAESTLSLLANTSYTVTIGAGGTSGASGSNSVFSTITSNGGGSGYGTNGGSGGGGSPVTNGVTAAGGTGQTNQGFGGGSGLLQIGTQTGSGGGGGAAAVGQNSGSNIGGNGGNGISSSITGTAVTRAGGGGGSGGLTGGTGGSGGGGNGISGSGNNTNNGTANTGSGGGGSGVTNGNTGAAGGSGIVIVRYAV